MVSGAVRRVFPGGNTPHGFRSFFDHIIRQDEASWVVTIKGGPGVGKSTLMKAVAETFLERGLDVECHHCSADPSSLDAIALPAAGVALMDGTRPHIVDPQTPGAVDEIINLGQHWNAEGIRRQKREILSLGKAIRDAFQRAYRYLAASRCVYGDIEAIHADAVSFGWLNQQAADLVQTLFKEMPEQPRPGRTRRLFASSITPEGPVHHLPSLLDPSDRVVVLRGQPGTGRSTLIAKAAAAAIDRGLSVEAFHCPMDPDRIEHAIIPELGIGITTSAWPHVWEGKADLVIETDVALNKAHLKRFRGELQRARSSFRQLFDNAVDALKKAKELHDELEGRYVPHMRFDELHAVKTALIERIAALL